MANLGRKNGVYLARFRFQGKEYKRSLKTSNKKDAEAAMHGVERALHRLAVGVLAVPPGVDPGDFIVSGGTLTSPAPAPGRRPVPTLGSAVQEFLGDLGHLAESNRYTVGVHLRNLQKKLVRQVDAPLDRVERRDLEAYLQARLKERAHTTVSKERETVVGFFRWAVARAYLGASPAADLTRVKAGGDPPPFRTVQEIEAIVNRGGLSESESWGLWRCLYLTPAEIGEVLRLVRERAKHDVSFLLHAIPAYTGVRRGELLRLRWGDIEFDQDSLVARSKKQSRQAVETKRRIDLHPELKAILLDWQKRRPRGQFVACDADSLDPLTPKEANRRFWQPLRGTAWCLSSRKNRFKINFHCYRHSFASNLAAAGVDQRVIDQFMGHETECMRKRYRHLFPKTRRSAIESLAYGTQEVIAELLTRKC
jgi:integrase